MKRISFSRLSLLWKILLSTSVSITLLFALAGWIVQNNTSDTISESIQEEVQSSFQAYKSLWDARARRLESISLVMSSMSDVRAAFRTGDQATIQDTAKELWSKVSDEDALFLVTDAEGRLVASLGGPLKAERQHIPVVTAATRYFPRQARGFMVDNGEVYEVVVTPVYLESPRGPAVWDVLVAGFRVDWRLAQSLKESTGGSEFLFLWQGKPLASTLNPRATERLTSSVQFQPGVKLVSDGANEYSPLMTPLLDIEGRPIGELWILRSMRGASERLAALRRNIVLLWLLAVCMGLSLTYVLARKIVRPIKELALAAEKVAQQNYDSQVRVESADELGVLAKTFNAMCESIRDAREELIRQERISTIGRMSSSIVHDLRNPLSAIYGGSEMLADTDLPPAQVKRLATAIYKASRNMQQLLTDLLDVSRQKTGVTEVCRLHEIVEAARESVVAKAEARSVRIETDVPDHFELRVERARIERVFMNLISNAIDAMLSGGAVRISAREEASSVLIEVQDDGPGIPDEVRKGLFKPFVTAGKKNGLGLGLALSRQTVLDHGGDMWVKSEPGRGAQFFFRIPLSKTSQDTFVTTKA